MDLYRPSEIRVSSETELLLGDAEAELRSLRGLGDFTADVLDEIRKEFLPQRLSDTLNIEGVNVNPRVTRAVLEGLALSEADRYNEREITNAIRANDFMEREASHGATIAPGHVRELQRLITDGLVDTPGAYREKDVEITGASFTPPSSIDIPELVQRLCDLCAAESRQVSPIAMACWIHASFGAIHPFIDGNGRTGRLLQDWLLVAAGYFPVGIPASRRGEYYESLQSADSGDFTPLVGIVANSELTALERARRIALAPQARMRRIRELARKSQQTVTQRHYNQYEVWRRRTDGIREEFTRWTNDLSSEFPDLHIRVKVWDPISFDKWEEIRERGRTTGTWLFTLTFSVRRVPIFSWLFYARRHEVGYTIEYEDMEDFEGLVSVFVTGDNEPESEWDFGQFSDPYVSLRELLYVGDDLYAYHEAPAEHLTELESPGEADTRDRGRPIWETRKGAYVADEVELFLVQCLTKFGLIE